MSPSGFSLFAAVLALSLAPAARAQVAAPSLVEEDLPAEDAPAPGVEDRAPEQAAPEPRAATPPSAVSPSARAPARAWKIEPVRAATADLRAAWQLLRIAQREQDLARTGEGRARLLALKEELAIENLPAFASAELRDAERALATRRPADALAHAELAVKLAPALPEPRLALARARFALAPYEPRPIAAALWEAATATAADPRASRAAIAGLFAALGAALLCAGAAAILLLFLRRLPLFLHDTHDLPLLRRLTPLQGALVALAVLGLPLALGLGPLACLAAAVAAVWLHLTQRERLVATAALLALTAAPFAIGQAARLTSFTGTLADDVWQVEHADGDASAARLAARVGQGAVPPAVLAALGDHAKRRGDLAVARGWYERAIGVGGRNAAVLVNLGNVHLLRGNVEAARATWLDASDRAGDDLEAFAAAQLDLAKLYVRESALEQAEEARRRATAAAPRFVERAVLEDPRANRVLVDAPLPASSLSALGEDDVAAELAREARVFIAGPLPPASWPWAPLGFVALLWLAAATGGRLAPSHACEKCGRAVCRRCDRAAGLLCGQCVNVYVRRGAVDLQDRQRKQEESRRHARLARRLARFAALLGGGAGQIARGDPIRGFVLLTLLFFAAFLALFGTAGWLAAAIPLGAVAYLVAVRDVFRRTRPARS